MNALLILLAAAAADQSEPPIIPAFFTGERLLEICTLQDAGFCSMYVAGVADGIFHAETGGPRTLCSGDLTNRDARKIVTGYLRDHPEVREHAAAVAVELALRPLIGCAAQSDADATTVADDQKGK